MLHREALVAKKMKSKQSEQNILENIFLDVVTIINEIRTRPKVSREFSPFRKDSLADHDTIILRTEVFVMRKRWRHFSFLWKNYCHERK